MEGGGVLAKNSRKNLEKSEAFCGVAAHSAEQYRERRARIARDVLNTNFHRQRSKFAFQRAGRLLFCPRAMRGPGRAGTPSSSAE